MDTRDLLKGVARTLDRHAARFEEEVYRLQFHYHLPLLERNWVTATAVLLSADGWSMAQVMGVQNPTESQVG